MITSITCCSIQLNILTQFNRRNSVLLPPTKQGMTIETLKTFIGPGDRVNLTVQQVGQRRLTLYF